MNKILIEIDEDLKEHQSNNELIISPQTPPDKVIHPLFILTIVFTIFVGSIMIITNNKYIK